MGEPANLHVSHLQRVLQSKREACPVCRRFLRLGGSLTGLTAVLPPAQSRGFKGTEGRPGGLQTLARPSADTYPLSSDRPESGSLDRGAARER